MRRQKSGQRWGEAANRRITRIGMHTVLPDHQADADALLQVVIRLCEYIFVPYLFLALQ